MVEIAADDDKTLIDAYDDWRALKGRDQEDFISTHPRKFEILLVHDAVKSKRDSLRTGLTHESQLIDAALVTFRGLTPKNVKNILLQDSSGVTAVETWLRQQLGG